MSGSLVIAAPGEARRIAAAREFCTAFADPTLRRPRVLFGRNVYARDLVASQPIDAVVDDFCPGTQFEGVPVIGSADIPRDALVLALSGGRPLTVADKLDGLGVQHLDYFAFLRHSGRVLRPIVFNEGFEADFEAHRTDYEAVHERLADDESRESYRKLVSFRLKGDIELLRGFTYREPEQYFEPFLDLRPQGEVFFDVGCFDGYTSREFARHCPGYAEIHAFEPEASNRIKCEAALAELPRAHLHPVGLASAAMELSMASAGSASTVSSSGDQRIRVVPLDTLDLPDPTLIKIDIEGGELDALDGARGTITRARPRLALAAYHQSTTCAPLRQIPARVLGFDPRYALRLRHYTESIYETVMFFLPGC